MPIHRSIALHSRELSFKVNLAVIVGVEICCRELDRSLLSREYSYHTLDTFSRFTVSPLRSRNIPPNESRSE